MGNSQVKDLSSDKKELSNTNLGCDQRISCRRRGHRMKRNLGNTIIYGFGMVGMQMVLQEKKAKLGQGYSKAGGNHTKQFANNSSGDFPT